MPHKQLTQAGLNKVIWHLLKRIGGKFTISEKAVEAPSLTAAIRIDHDAATKTFTLSLQKVKKPKQSLIIQPSMN